jgi:hypothetical protein
MGIHSRSIRRQAPTGGPLAERLDLVARGHSNEDDQAAAIVVRSLWAALGEVCVVGLVVGWVVVRLAVCWPVSVEVVVAVDIEVCVSIEKVRGLSVTGESRKTPWLVTVFGA